MSRPGLFVTFEGGDGAGKTTLMDRVVEMLSAQGVEYIRTREPGGSPLGDQVRTLLLSFPQGVSPRAELYLFLAARAQHIEELIKPALQAGKVVLCDRFNDSSIAYQGAARGLGVEQVTQACELVCGSVKPDLTFYLDLDPKIGLERAKRSGQPDRIESEQLAFHQAVRAGFMQLAVTEPDRIRVVDASRSPDEVFKAVKRHLEPAIHDLVRSR